MTTLLETLEVLRGLVASGDTAAVEGLLQTASADLAGEPDPSVILEYARLCHDWGTPEAEEAAVRAALARGRSLETIEQLLDLLHAQLNRIEGTERAKVVEEAESLAGEALRLLGTTSGLRWANLTHSRGLRRAELVALGRQEHGEGGRADLVAYQSWLAGGTDVPEHLRRANLVALADLDLAELDILEGCNSAAQGRIERAISILEGERAPKWMVERGYALLERAET